MNNEEYNQFMNHIIEKKKIVLFYKPQEPKIQLSNEMSRILKEISTKAEDFIQIEEKDIGFPIS